MVLPRCRDLLFPYSETEVYTNVHLTVICAVVYREVNRSSSIAVTAATTSNPRGVGARAGRIHVNGAAQSYRAFLRSEGGLLRELKECRQDSIKVHLVCSNYGKYLVLFYFIWQVKSSTLAR